MEPASQRTDAQQDLTHAPATPSTHARTTVLLFGGRAHDKPSETTREKFPDGPLSTLASPTCARLGQRERTERRATHTGAVLVAARSMQCATPDTRSPLRHEAPKRETPVATIRDHFGQQQQQQHSVRRSTNSPEGLDGVRHQRDASGTIPESTSPPSPGLWGRVRTVVAGGWNGTGSSPPSPSPLVPFPRHSDGRAAEHTPAERGLLGELCAQAQPMRVLPRPLFDPRAQRPKSRTIEDPEATAGRKQTPWYAIDMDTRALTCEACGLDWEDFDIAKPSTNDTDGGEYAERVLLRSAGRARGAGWWCEIMRGPARPSDAGPVYFVDLTFVDIGRRPQRGIVRGSCLAIVF